MAPGSFRGSQRSGIIWFSCLTSWLQDGCHRPTHHILIWVLQEGGYGGWHQPSLLSKTSHSRSNLFSRSHYHISLCISLARSVSYGSPSLQGKLGRGQYIALGCGHHESQLCPLKTKFFEGRGTLDINKNREENDIHNNVKGRKSGPQPMRWSELWRLGRKFCESLKAVFLNPSTTDT